MRTLCIVMHEAPIIARVAAPARPTKLHQDSQRGDRVKRQRRGGSHVRNTHAAEVENLEDRTLLSATLVAGVLTVTGTAQGDQIRLRVEGNQLDVHENDVKTSFALANVTQITVNALGGDDRVTISRAITINATVNGGEGNDRIKGGSGNDTLNGNAGNDKIDGRDGNDNINGGEDEDYLRGGDGNDIIDGGNGNDRIRGSKGNDTISGDAGDDEISGGDGDDDISGGAGNDKIGGGDGDDEVHGGANNDILKGGKGIDNILGETGDDVIIGDSSEDTTLDGGAGDDWTHDKAHLLGENATQQEIQARAAEIFAYLNSNNDQFLTQTGDNLSDHQWSRLNDFDDNSDQKISPTEFANFVQHKIDDDGEGKRLLRFFGVTLSRWYR